MGAPPLISVIIPAYNAAQHMAECLSSVAHEAADIPHETIVVDDGSVDATADIARRHPGVCCITQGNSGPSAARNRGIAEARGEFIAFLDADDLWPVGKLRAQLRTLREHPKVALIFGDCRQFDAKGPYPRTEFHANRLGEAAWGPGPVVPDAYARLLEVNFITTGSVIVRRPVLAQLGGFAEDLRLVEDLELWLRIARRHPIAWCASPCLLRRRHSSNISRDSEAMAIAYLEVLRRHSLAWHDGDSLAVQVDEGQLASRKYLYMAELAASQGQAGASVRRAWASFTSHPRPETLWRIAKTAARLAVQRRG
jgi:glycosyltransferase involved in cell wall biosynthesis